MTDFQESLNDSLKNNLNRLKNQFELNQLEIGPLKSPITIEFYEKWLHENNYGGMNYLKDHLPIKKNPLLINGQIKSVISISQNYFPIVKPSPNILPARIALYAQNQDYHFWLKQKLNSIIEELTLIYPNQIFLPYVDSGPILERDLAYQNKLGWFGKNTCLIHPQFGSLFFIAEIFTDININDLDFLSMPLPDFCGKCQKCLEVCPTQAITAPKTIKANQCISYLTIEAKGPAPIDLRKKIGDWFFGCDLCQTVCPWNEKVFRLKNINTSDEISTANKLQLHENKKLELIKYFKFLLTASHGKIQKFHFGSALSRAGAKGLKRNALIVIANQNLIELKDCVEKLNTEDLTELRDWTLQQLS